MIRKWIDDFYNFRWKNQEEDRVLSAHYISAYKGKLVFRIRGQRSGSFGVLFITKNAKSKDVVRHEYGHTLQLKELGIWKYLLYIGIPSWKEWKKSIPYYERPWEVTADVFGEVKGRMHQEDIKREGLNYLAFSKSHGFLTWRKINKG